MKLTRNDARATIVVAAAVVFYLLWATETVATGVAPRIVAGIVFALGWLGCTSDVEGMKKVYGPDAAARPSAVYVVLASLLGGVALVAGIVAIGWANEAMLATMVVAMTVLWLMTTIRHALTRPIAPVVEHPSTLPRAA
ncbi:MAG TPA: hypothetical protein VIE12_12835 [Actinomycetota bacterium]|jgi:hypothetical protein